MSSSLMWLFISHWCKFLRFTPLVAQQLVSELIVRLCDRLGRVRWRRCSRVCPVDGNLNRNQTNRFEHKIIVQTNPKTFDLVRFLFLMNLNLNTSKNHVFRYFQETISVNVIAVTIWNFVWLDFNIPKSIFEV